MLTKDNRVWMLLVVMAAVGAACQAPDPEPDGDGTEPASDASTETVVEERLVPVNGTELFVMEMGAGEPILIVHGGPVLEHGYLLPHLAPLAEGYRLVFYDQRLSGRSAGEVEAESVRIATFVEDIEALRVALGLERIHLLAHSWGGLLAMHYALEHGEHLRSLILVSPMSASSELWQQEQSALAQRTTDEDKAESRAIRDSEAFAARQPEAIEQLLLLSFRPQFHDPDQLAQLRLYVPPDYSERSRQFGAMMVDLTSYDLHERLEAVTTPTLIVFGAVEPGAEIGGVALNEHMPSSELVLIEDAGHFAFIEQRDSFLESVRTFLAGL